MFSLSAETFVSMNDVVDEVAHPPTQHNTTQPQHTRKTFVKVDCEGRGNDNKKAVHRITSRLGSGLPPQKT